MKNKSVILIALGALLLVVGAIMNFAGGPPSADPALAVKCQQTMMERGADAAMIAQCKQAAFATAMTATDANAAAGAISAANKQEVGGNAIAMFLIGLGFALIAGGIFFRRQQKPVTPVE